MKKVLVVGKNSYVGQELNKWITNKYSSQIKLDLVGSKNGEWETIEFSKYDSIIHVAGIAHIREKKSNENIYKEINTNLAESVAKKAKKAGVKQFVFLSSMSVYGLTTGVITRNTKAIPNSYYGKSKLEAEHKIKNLVDDNFTLAIVRPPMIYGLGCKGNYQKISKMSKITPFFPKVNNSRSMLHIYNLTELLSIIILNQKSGYFFPQNKEYVDVGDLVITIGEIHFHKIYLIRGLKKIINNIRLNVFEKVFGNLIYEKEMSLLDEDYHVIDYYNSVVISEKQSKLN
ncbi:NAD-dependent epimerase/dehydratase family protein [Exiguobacterium sp. s146]|uniref:NAD-dependent epimerase/dehydratase family protein n=1 Tax=Exiguobacterium sp. s146 TaxID=2751223 RepID=UPI001BEA4BE7